MSKQIATFFCSDEDNETVAIPLHEDKRLHYDGEIFTAISEVADHIGSSLSIETVEAYEEKDD